MRRKAWAADMLRLVVIVMVCLFGWQAYRHYLAGVAVAAWAPLQIASAQR